MNIEFIHKPNDEIYGENGIKHQLVRVDPYKVNIVPLIAKEELFTKVSGEIFCLSKTSRIGDLLPMNLYTLEKNINPQ